MADDSLRQIITRSEARTAGLKRYFTGKPCSRGHVAERLANSGNCIVCSDGPERKARRVALRLSCPERYSQKNRKYRAENPEKKRASAAAYREKNREKLRTANAEYSRANREKGTANAKRWAKNNPDKIRNREGKRRWSPLENTGLPASSEISSLLIKQKHRCGWCGCSIRRLRELDHIIPISKGGSHTMKNLLWSCRRCNRRKNNKDPIVFARENGFLI